MQPPLTPSQQRVFSWIEAFIAQHGMAPTYREIQKGLGYRSLASVQLHIHALTERRLISHLPRKSRSLKVLRPSDGIPIMGAIAATSLVETFPDQDVQHLELSCLPKFANLSQHDRSQHFALQVRGDSMVGALIDHGDIVIMRRESNPRSIRNGTILLPAEMAQRRLNICIVRGVKSPSSLLTQNMNPLLSIQTLRS